MWSWAEKLLHPTDIPDGQLRVAKARVSELESRAEKVVPELTARRDRNHWGETIAEIARRGRPA